jgi:hypothetical protein
MAISACSSCGKEGWFVKKWKLCRPCYSKKVNKRYLSQRAIYSKKRREANPELFRKRQRATSLKRLYGMSENDYQKLLILQNGQCGLCGKFSNSKRLSVDHCHQTGKIRGLVCPSCNFLLGYIEKYWQLLDKAKIYLNNSRLHGNNA